MTPDRAERTGGPSPRRTLSGGRRYYAWIGKGAMLRARFPALDVVQLNPVAHHQLSRSRVLPRRQGSCGEKRRNGQKGPSRHPALGLRLNKRVLIATARGRSPAAAHCGRVVFPSGRRGRRAALSGVFFGVGRTATQTP